jgi:hypothetical protein
MRILQIRLDDVNSNESRSCVGYRDWSAKTDVAIANALSNDTNGSAAGKRCAFVGWELCDDGNQPEITRSLNVEELALEEYHAGRLPNPSDENGESMIRGNWKGFHDEGGHIRKLFRIVFLHVVLENNAEEDDPTILLSPYQQSPNDLHVGYHKVKIVAHQKFSFIHGFYERRRNSIEKFLKSLSQQTDQDVSDLVYNCLKSRWDSHANDDSRVKDVQLSKDVSELRTLSMIAAGLGGQALSSIFRAFTFDYRHYSGGLPDLLLTRARYKSAANQFVDLGEWVGEAFCKDYIEEDNINRCISMLADRDDDFLGCSKNSDSGLFSSRKKMQKKVLIPTTFPNKLQLLHNEKQVKVDCMFVEVKSVNDRLDARQEDWLNIIDKFADARVCKFVSKNQSK